MTTLVVALKAHGRRPAVLGDGVCLSYAELALAVGAVARGLVAAGVVPGQPVAVFSGRSIEAVVALHAILRVGAVVVPLDPMAPPARNAAIIEDCGAQVVLVEKRVRRRARALAGRVAVKLVALGEPESAVPGVELPAPPDAGDTALVLYTSGTTGTPKGVVLTHRAVHAFATWAVTTFGLSPSDVLPHLSPLTFDLCTLELFASALAGAAVWVAPSGITATPRLLADGLDRVGATVVYAVPSVWIRLAAAPPVLQSLRWLLYAGEAFAPAALSVWMDHLRHARVANLFGPTESNVCCWHEVTAPPTAPVPIGRAACGYRVRVVGNNGHDAVIGELWVSGDALMSGYLGRPEATARVLVTHAGHTWLRTGDRVRRDADGQLHFLGRIDRQLKRGGFRVQPEELEGLCGEVPGVTAAWVGLVDGALVARVEGDTTEQAVRRVLARSLPRSLLPDRIEVATLARGPRGKVQGASQHYPRESERGSEGRVAQAPAGRWESGE